MPCKSHPLQSRQLSLVNIWLDLDFLSGTIPPAQKCCTRCAKSSKARPGILMIFAQGADVEDAIEPNLVVYRERCTQIMMCMWRQERLDDVEVMRVGLIDWVGGLGGLVQDYRPSTARHVWFIAESGVSAGQGLWTGLPERDSSVAKIGRRVEQLQVMNAAL